MSDSDNTTAPSVMLSPTSKAGNSAESTHGVTVTAPAGNPETTVTQSNTSPLSQPFKYIGQRHSRVDARLKVTGRAKYAADYSFDAMAYGVAICSTIASGQVTSIDTSAAQKAPGILAVITSQNAPPLFRTRNEFDSSTKSGEKRQLFEDEQIYYAGQILGVVVGETLEQAIAAESLIKISYAETKPTVETTAAVAAGEAYEPKEAFGEKLKESRGNPQKDAEAAPVKIEAEYTTPIEHHNPMETQAAVARWEEDNLTLFDTTQWVMGARNVVAESLGISPEKVRIISRYVGGGFGCKGFIWPHETLAAIAAWQVQRPVKVALTRRQMYSNTGHRAETRQKIVLAADPTGKLLSTIHHTVTQTSKVDEFVETCGKTSAFLYNCPSFESAYLLATLNIGTPTPMRAPGESVGTFALESAMDELAHKVGVDPIQLRLLNYAEVDPSNKKPWSSKNLKDCYEKGAKMIGWERRRPQPASFRDGQSLIGLGMATATYPAMRSPGAAKVRVSADGTVLVTSATQDIGTGTYTTMTITAAEILGLPLDVVRAELGDSRLPPAPVSGGSMTTASVIPAVEFAAQQAVQKLCKLAAEDVGSPLHGAKPEEIIVAGKGLLALKSESNRTDSFVQILRRKKLAAIEGESLTKPGEEREKYHFQSFGAQFAEVAIDPDLGIVRLKRLVGVFDIGRAISPTTAISNLMGGMVWGIGMALLEHTVYDERDGRVVTDNLADYLLPVNLDVPRIEVAIIDKPDPYINSLGARGLGEIGITGVAGAIANAIFNATGKRVRDLPITLDKLA